jgi:hypothetical protein
MKLPLRRVSDRVRTLSYPKDNILPEFIIGPTCKKMNDLSATKTFKSSAFEPSDEELSKAARTNRKKRSRVERDESTEDENPPPKKFTGSKLDLDDSSDEEFPDVADLFAGRGGKKKIKKEIKTDSPVKASATIEDVGIYYFLYACSLIYLSLSRTI